MRRISAVALLATLMVAGVQAVDAQILETRLRSTTSPTTDQLLERIVALEARVARLESLLAVVNGTVVLDGRGAPVVVRGGSITIQPDGVLTLKAGNSVSIEASAALWLRAGGGMTVEAAGRLGLTGSTMMLNNGVRPVACVGAMTAGVPGTTAQTVTGQVVTGQTCGASVLVP